MRIALATLLLVGAAGIGLVRRRGRSWSARCPILLAFFLGWVRFAVDLVDLVAAELVADLAAPVAVVLALRARRRRQHGAGRLLLVAAAAAQALPRVRAHATRAPGVDPRSDGHGQRDLEAVGDGAGDRAELGVPAVAEHVVGRQRGLRQVRDALLVARRRVRPACRRPRAARAATSRVSVPARDRLVEVG